MSKLTDLPVELKEKIANVLDYKAKMSLRQVSKDFKEAVDDSQFFYDRLHLRWNSRLKVVEITLYVGDGSVYRKELEFHDTLNGYIVKNKAEKWEKKVNSVNYIDAAMKHFWKILHHRNRAKIHLNQLGLRIPNNLIDQTKECFRSSMKQFNEKFKPDPSNKTKLSVKTLEVLWTTDPEIYLNVISSLKPGTLEKLDFSQISDFARIAETDQWKRAKWLQCAEISPDIDTSHFSTLLWEKSTIELEEMKELVDQFFLNPTWDVRYITDCSYDKEAFKKHLFGKKSGNNIVIQRGQDACKLILDEICIAIDREVSSSNPILRHLL